MSFFEFLIFKSVKSSLSCKFFQPNPLHASSPSKRVMVLIHCVVLVKIGGPWKSFLGLALTPHNITKATSTNI